MFNSPPPNTRMQRTRSSASPPRSPLMRCPLGGSWASVLAGVVLAGGSVSCASWPSPMSQVCPGAPVEVGTLRTSGLGFRLVGPNGTPLSGFLWRYRQNLILPGGWEEWERVEGEECRRFQACGYAGVTDLEERAYEIEICPNGYRPIHLYMDVRDAAKPLPIVLTAVAE
jgi:hypothetical protein